MIKSPGVPESAEVIAEALRREWRSAGIIMGDAITGAARFADGKGRGGDFGDI